MVDVNDNPVIVALHLNKAGHLGSGNKIASGYGRKEYETYIREQRKLGNVLYEKKSASAPVSGLQLSSWVADTDSMFNIPSAKADVKGRLLPTARELRANADTKTAMDEAIENGDKTENYIVAFDVEVFPGQNQYKTHRIVNEIDLIPVGSSDAGSGPAERLKESSLRNNVVVTSNIADV